MAGRRAGTIGVALFLAGAIVIGDAPPFDASGAEVAAHVERKRAEIQIACALNAMATAFLVWFLATVWSLAQEASPGARRAGNVAFGAGLVFLAVFLIDVTALAVSALRPENLIADPELAAALRDFEWLAIGMATPVGVAMLGAFAVLALRERALWAQWVGVLAAVAAPLYLLRIGTLFTTEGPFAADGVLGLYVPVAALLTWLFIASEALVRDSAA